MSPSVTCYPQPGKAKSRQLLEAFAAGCGGAVAPNAASLAPGCAAFFGVVGIEALFQRARARGGWIYGDNAFFDAGRGRLYRFARDAFQIDRLAPPDFGRLKALGISPRPWRPGGSHIVVVEQGQHFLELVGEPGWLDRTAARLKEVTDRPLRIRRWNRDKMAAAATLPADLAGAWALVTHTSAAANEALLAGVPAFVTGRCAASPLAQSDLAGIESARPPEGVLEWAAGLAARQWSIEELRTGKAWRALSEQGMESRQGMV